MLERKIFVTGGSSGLGKELIVQSLNRGLSSFFHQRTNSTSELGVEFVYGDIKDLKTQDDIIDFVKENKINVFINNAAIYSNKSIKDVTYNEINELVSVNLLSPLLLTKRVLDIFSEQGYGMIYNINSLAGINGSKNESIYCATKHGLKGLTESLKYEYKGQKNIRIVARQLISRITNLCEKCAAPGFGKITYLRGLKCTICGIFDDQAIQSELLTCISCDHQLPGKLISEALDPAKCNWCNR